MGSLGSWFPVYDGNPYTYIGAYNSTLYNNGALMPLGTVACVSLPASALGTAKGKGSYLIMKYVQYKAASAPSPVAGPAPVYYIDETLTAVSGAAADASGLNGAGFLLPNTTSISGLTDAMLENNFVWIGLAGVIPGCAAPASTAVGDLLVASGTSSFLLARSAFSASANGVSARPMGYAMSAVSGGLSDVMAAMVAF